MNRWALLLSLFAIATGCVDREANALGGPVNGAVSSIAEAQQTNLNAAVVLRGTMKLKCPTAGCWFMLEDSTGIIKVDTKSAGFVMVDIPVNSLLLVAGGVVTNGSERIIEATGLRRADAR